MKTSTHSQVKVTNVIKLLNNLCFIALHNSAEVQLGTDLLFWYHYTQFFRNIILQDHYVHALKARSRKGTSRSTKPSKRKAALEPEIYQDWKIVSARYEAELEQYAAWMPNVCTTGFAKLPDRPQQYDLATLLRYFSEVLLTEIATHTPTPAAFKKQILDTIVLKAGGVGITLAKANHVFHFKRWWNPAVEDQATDRTFRIGQKKNDSVHTCPQLIARSEEMNVKTFWQGTKPLPRSVPTFQPSSVTGIVIKKQGDRLPVWHNDSSFIAAMEELYDRMKSKNQSLF